MENHLDELKNIDNNNEDEDNYLYLLNKSWFKKAFQFLSDYEKFRNNNSKEDYFSIAFNPEYCYKKYFDTNKENMKNIHKYVQFPCNIDNYSIINWTDNLNDPSNEDENYIVKKNLKEGKDYFLLQKNDFIFLQNFFGVTNIIKRKKNCEAFIEIKAILLEERLYEKENKKIIIS